MINTLTRILLILSAVILLVIGGAILFSPHAFYASSGIILGNDASLLSEVRAPGGLLLGCAVIILLGAFKPTVTQNALILATMVYGLFGIARLIGIFIDGLPSSSIVAVMSIELVVGALCVFTLQRYKFNQAALS